MVTSAALPSCPLCRCHGGHSNSHPAGRWRSSVSWWRAVRSPRAGCRCRRSGWSCREPAGPTPSPPERCLRDEIGGCQSTASTLSEGREQRASEQRRYTVADNATTGTPHIGLRRTDDKDNANMSVISL